MTSLIDRSYFVELAARDPEEVCRRTACSFDDRGKGFTLSVWGEDIGIYPHRFLLRRVGGDPEAVDDFLGLFVLYYLLHNGKFVLEDQWISEKDIPGGTSFFRGPHAIPTQLITQAAKHIHEFRQICGRLGGEALQMADAAFRFEITPQIPVAVLYWEGDEEFSAEAKILFDKSITGHLPLDIVFALAVAVCNKIGGR